jgi:hypothetical protein
MNMMQPQASLPLVLTESLPNQTMKKDADEFASDDEKGKDAKGDADNASKASDKK